MGDCVHTFFLSLYSFSDESRENNNIGCNQNIGNFVVIIIVTVM